MGEGKGGGGGGKPSPPQVAPKPNPPKPTRNPRSHTQGYSRYDKEVYHPKTGGEGGGGCLESVEWNGGME